MGQLPFVELVKALLADADAAGVHSVQPSHQVQQGAFATARFAHQRQAAAFTQVQVDASQNSQRALRGRVVFNNTLHLQHKNAHLKDQQRE